MVIGQHAAAAVLLLLALLEANTTTKSVMENNMCRAFRAGISLGNWGQSPTFWCVTVGIIS